jgi:hypothetical protein
MMTATNSNAQTWGGSTTQTGNTFRTGYVGIGNSTPSTFLDIRQAPPVSGPYTFLPEIKLTTMTSMFLDLALTISPMFGRCMVDKG